MDRPYVDRLFLQNYGCIEDATLSLTRLHALVGPNDSGKSTVLRALRTLSLLCSPSSSRALAEEQALSRAMTANTGKGPVVLEADVSGHQLRISCEGAANTSDWRFIAMTTERPNYGERSWQGTDLFANAPLYEYLSSRGRGLMVARALAGSQLLRLEPEALRSPHALIPSGQPLELRDARGTGLPAIYDALMVRDIDAFIELRKSISGLFPNVHGISLVNADVDKKAICVKLADGTLVPAEQMSEGLLYYLTFVALRHMNPVGMILIEEPENGLHPARVVEIMRVLRAISETTQVIIATHSPIVVNELRGDEVTVMTRPAGQGARGVLIKDTPEFEERSKVYETGELWASYANGIDEGPLVRGSSTQR
jgi:predicted ATPase